MRVMVTGGAGFIGSHVVDALAGIGATISVLDSLYTGSIENIQQRVNFYRGDLLDGEFVYQCVQKECPEVIIHHAARVSVPKSLVNPAEDAGTNIVGSVNLIEAARACRVRKVIYASSAAVYGSPDYLPVDEKHPVKPLSGYGLSKHTVERYLELYNDLYGLDYTVLRYANVYGPRQDAQGEGGVVSIFFDCINRGVQPVIHGDGNQTRDFVHVSDIAAANLCAINKGGGNTLNISTASPVTINSLFEIIKAATGYGGDALYDSPRPGDIRDSWLDCARAASVLDWSARLALEQGIGETLKKF